MSTRDTPEVAASPTLDTIMVSTMPTDTARICSTISGKISFLKSALENMYPPGFLFSMCLYRPLCCGIIILAGSYPIFTGPYKNDAECFL